MIIEIMDLFPNLTRYIQTDTPLEQVLRIQLLFLPSCIKLGLPIAMIFASAFTLGNLYANNELIAVFSSGISLFKFSLPIFFVGLILSIFSFWFQEDVVIDSQQKKTQLSNEALGFRGSTINRNIIIYDKQLQFVYNAASYNDNEKILRNVYIVKRNEALTEIQEVLFADEAIWTNETWELHGVYQYLINKKKDIKQVAESYIDSYTDPEINKSPKSFRRQTQKIDELHLGEARNLILEIQNSGLPYKSLLLNYHERFSFALTPLIVAFLSCSIGSRFRKNVLFLSLFISLLIAVSYYVLQMVMGIIAGFNLVDPGFGAWFSTSIYLVLGSWLFIKARS